MSKAPKEKKSLKKIIISTAYNIFLALLILIAVISVYNNINDRVTFIFGYTIVVVKTESMEPLIPTGECILLKKAAPEDVKTGDVITFYSDDPLIEGSLNTHRVEGVLKKDGKYEFYTKGDNNLGRDSYTAKGGKLLGKYVTNLGFLSAISTLFMGKYGIYLMAAAFLLIVALMYLPEIIKRIKTSGKKSASSAQSVSGDIQSETQATESVEDTAEIVDKTINAEETAEGEQSERTGNDEAEIVSEKESSENTEAPPVSGTSESGE